MYLLKKRTVDCVVLPSLSTRPQEPRRPRFSFFQSSQCQRADPGCGFRRRRRWKRQLPNFERTVTCFRLPGSTSALSVSADQWEQLVLGVVNVAGCIRDIFVCQHPHFNFRKVRILKAEISNFLALSEVCFSLWRRFRRRGLQRWAGYRGDPFEVSTAQNDESDIFRGHPPGQPSNPSGALYSTRARGLSSGVRNRRVQGARAMLPPPVEISAGRMNRRPIRRFGGRHGRLALQIVRCSFARALTGQPPRPSFAALSSHQGVSQ
jgi:hypothetical protein